METGHGIKYRQLHIEDYLQKIPAEQGRTTGVYAHEWITGNPDTNTDFWMNNLLDTILRSDNLNAAYKKVKANRGAGGIDGMQVDALLPYLKDHREELLQQLREGKYKPNPVRRVEIPKEEKGKVRKLGIPTVVDRMVQQAIAQELTPIYEEQFSDNSFGFRPKRGAHDALKRCKEYVDEGYVNVVSMDLQSYFDTVNHSKLIEVLSRTIKDGRVISLIHKYLNAGVMEDGGFHATTEGVPQGGPLSPLLGNVMLNELDKELEQRGHKFVRYADDCIIFCKSQKSAERTLNNIVPYITDKLFLKINLQKTTVSHVGKLKYLGYGFYRYRGKCRLRVHPKSVAKMKNRLRELTTRGNKWSNVERERKLREYTTGWINYFRYADMKTLMEQTDEWLRRRIRAVYWKQWKKVRTRYRMLRALHLPEWKVHEMANCRKGTWRAAKMLNSALTKTVIVGRLGYPSMTDHYLKVRVNY
ncbi:MAG: group II intron reverse transcriptase/maturase [Lachnospiraceae bacterium]|nr:group II intron reverse transcriptase/maturase [Lachnospiraceae bacterium]